MKNYKDVILRFTIKDFDNLLTHSVLGVAEIKLNEKIENFKKFKCVEEEIKNYKLKSGNGTLQFGYTLIESSKKKFF